MARSFLLQGKVQQAKFLLDDYMRQNLSSADAARKATIENEQLFSNHSITIQKLVVHIRERQQMLKLASVLLRR